MAGDPTFSTRINAWVKLESDIVDLQNKIAVLRQERETEAVAIIAAVRARGLSKAVLQLKTCAVHMTTNNIPQSLTYTMLESMLKEYFTSTHQTDQTATIINFVKSHRTHKTVSKLDLQLSVAKSTL